MVSSYSMDCLYKPQTICWY